MAYEINVGYDITIPAGADLSASQYLFIKADGTVAGAGVQALGVLQNDPTSGKGASIRVMGVTKVYAGGTVALGDLVSSDASGKAVKYTAAAVNTSDAGTAQDPVNTGTHVMGIALTAGVSGDVIPVALVHAGLSN